MEDPTEKLYDHKGWLVARDRAEPILSLLEESSKVSYLSIPKVLHFTSSQNEISLDSHQ